MSEKSQMTYLLSETGRAALHKFLDVKTLLVFDLDGTLAPIAVDPAAIRISDEVREKMIQLCRIATVVILTGRSINDARSFLDFEPRLIVGNHGAEGLSGWEEQEKEFSKICTHWESQLLMNSPLVSDGNIVIENKGTSLSIHYRNVLDREEAHRIILQAIQSLAPPPERVSGKYVENVMPLEAPRKGKALLHIMKYMSTPRALFVGDDITDEDVFNLRNEQVFGVKIGNNPTSAAAFYLTEQHEIVDLLQIIIHMIKPESINLTEDKPASHNRGT